jgi:hypothetical protein
MVLFFISIAGGYIESNSVIKPNAIGFDSMAKDPSILGLKLPPNLRAT